MGAVVYALRPLFQADHHLVEARRLVDAARGRAESDRRGTLSAAAELLREARDRALTTAQAASAVLPPAAARVVDRRVHARLAAADQLTARVLAGRARLRLRRLPALVVRPANDLQLEAAPC